MDAGGETFLWKFSSASRSSKKEQVTDFLKKYKSGKRRLIFLDDSQEDCNDDTSTSKKLFSLRVQFYPPTSLGHAIMECNPDFRNYAQAGSEGDNDRLERGSKKRSEIESSSHAPKDQQSEKNTAHKKEIPKKENNQGSEKVTTLQNTEAGDTVKLCHNTKNIAEIEKKKGGIKRKAMHIVTELKEKEEKEKKVGDCRIDQNEQEQEEGECERRLSVDLKAKERVSKKNEQKEKDKLKEKKLTEVKDERKQGKKRKREKTDDDEERKVQRKEEQATVSEATKQTSFIAKSVPFLSRDYLGQDKDTDAKLGGEFIVPIMPTASGPRKTFKKQGRQNNNRSHTTTNTATPLAMEISEDWNKNLDNVATKFEEERKKEEARKKQGDDLFNYKSKSLPVTSSPASVSSRSVPRSSAKASPKITPIIQDSDSESSGSTSSKGKEKGRGRGRERGRGSGGGGGRGGKQTSDPRKGSIF